MVSIWEISWEPTGVHLLRRGNSRTQRKPPTECIILLHLLCWIRLLGDMRKTYENYICAEEEPVVTTLYWVTCIRLRNSPAWKPLTIRYLNIHFHHKLWVYMKDQGSRIMAANQSLPYFTWAYNHAHPYIWLMTQHITQLWIIQHRCHHYWLCAKPLWATASKYTSATIQHLFCASW